MGMNTPGLAFENRPSEIVVTPPRPPLESGRSQGSRRPTTRCGRNRPRVEDRVGSQQSQATPSPVAARVAQSPCELRRGRTRRLQFAVCSPPPRSSGVTASSQQPVAGRPARETRPRPVGVEGRRPDPHRGWKRGERLTVFGGYGQEGLWLPQGCVLRRGPMSWYPRTRLR